MEKMWIEIQQIISEKLTPWQKKVWIEPLSARFVDDELFIFAPSTYMANFVRVRFSELLYKVAKEVIGTDLQITFTASQPKVPSDVSSVRSEKVEEKYGSVKNNSLHPVVACSDITSEVEQLSSTPKPRPLPSIQMGLPIIAAAPKKQAMKWSYSFDDFIVGPCNELAHAASRSMCNADFSTDVLFLSSAPGLGKTHLMQSVGKHLYEYCNREAPKVEYLTAEEFASGFYLSLKTQQTDKFKARYRNLDLLLLEDVHFLQNKEKMQAELLSTLKALKTRGAKVVFTSSFLPTDLAQMDEQLQSRLCAGFVSSLYKPDLETRKKIFHQKADFYQVLLPEEVEETLATHIKNDVRQIESCLHNLILKARLFNSGITMQMAWDVICSYANHSPILDLDGIIDFICKGFNLSRDQLVSTRRKQEYVFARNAAFFLARKHTDLSLDAIGKQFNRRHSTVLKGITNIEREMSRQTPLGKQIANTLTMIERNGNVIGSRSFSANQSNNTPSLYQ